MTDKAEKTEKKHPLAATLEVILQPKVLITLAAIFGLGGGGAAMKVFADAGATGLTEDTARHISDSTTKAQLAPIKSQLDSVEARMGRLEKKQETLGEIQQGVFGAMMDADPKLKAAVKARAQQNQEATRKKAEDASLLNELTGGQTP